MPRLTSHHFLRPHRVVSRSRATIDPGSGFTVTVYPGPGTPFLVLAGELDLVAVPAIAAAAAELLAACRREAGGVVLIRTAGVTFLDCAALGTLVCLQNQLLRIGCNVVIEGARPSTLRLLTLTRDTHQLCFGSARVEPSIPAGVGAGREDAAGSGRGARR